MPFVCLPLQSLEDGQQGLFDFYVVEDSVEKLLPQFYAFALYVYLVHGVALPHVLLSLVQEFQTYLQEILVRLDLLDSECIP